MDHVQEWTADRVARLFPAEFTALDAFCAQHGQFEDETVAAFDREIQFYLGYLDFIAAPGFSCPTRYSPTSSGRKT